MAILDINKEAPCDPVQQEDLENIVLSNREEFMQRSSGTFLITGATGLIGSQIIKVLLCCNRILKTNFKVIGVVRNAAKAQDIFKALLDRPELELIVCDLNDPVSVEGNIDYIIHTASITASKLMMSNPVDVIRTSVLGTDHILRLAQEKGTDSVVYLSSMEVYGRSDQSYVSENNLGYLDLSSLRSCYPESKRICEALCNAYAHQYGIHVTSARLAQTFGPGILGTDRRVFVQFAESVLDNKDIVLHTEGKSEGNYCYLRDTIKAIFVLLFKGTAGESYNISNEANHMTIAQMAHLVADKIAGGTIKVVFDIPSDKNTYGYAPDTKLKLNTTKLCNLGWEPEVSLTEMYERMIQSMKFGRQLS